LQSNTAIIIIIIITNEKIEVMLSRKRCRGTLQDYNMLCSCLRPVHGWWRGSVFRTSVFGWRTFPDLCV